MRYVLGVLLLLGLWTAPAWSEDEACITVERVVDDLDDYEFWIAHVATTVAEVGCYCQGTCSTAATFSFADRTGNGIALTGGGNLPCQVGASDVTFVTTDAGDTDRNLVVGEGLRFSVANTPTSVDRVTLCVKFTF